MTETTTKTYYAKSILASKTFWVNLVAILAAVLEETEVVDLIPPAVQGYMLAAIAVINIVLRVYSVRPVAFVGPSAVKAVEVPTLYKVPGQDPKKAA